MMRGQTSDHETTPGLRVDSVCVRLRATAARAVYPAGRARCAIRQRSRTLGRPDRLVFDRVRVRVSRAGRSFRGRQLRCLPNGSALTGCRAFRLRYSQPEERVSSCAAARLKRRLRGTARLQLGRRLEKLGQGLRIALPLILVVVVHHRVDDRDGLGQLGYLRRDRAELVLGVVVVEPVGGGLESLAVPWTKEEAVPAALFPSWRMRWMGRPRRARRRGQSLGSVDLRLRRITFSNATPLIIDSSSSGARTRLPGCKAFSISTACLSEIPESVSVTVSSSPPVWFGIVTSKYALSILFTVSPRQNGIVVDAQSRDVALAQAGSETGGTLSRKVVRWIQPTSPPPPSATDSEWDEGLDFELTDIEEARRILDHESDSQFDVASITKPEHWKRIRRASLPTDRALTGRAIESYLFCRMTRLP
jgi:hypothetical protein